MWTKIIGAEIIFNPSCLEVASLAMERESTQCTIMIATYDMCELN